MFFGRASVHILACGFRKRNNSPLAPVESFERNELLKTLLDDFGIPEQGCVAEENDASFDFDWRPMAIADLSVRTST